VRKSDFDKLACLGWMMLEKHGVEGERLGVLLLAARRPVAGWDASGSVGGNASAAF